MLERLLYVKPGQIWKAKSNGEIRVVLAVFDYDGLYYLTYFVPELGRSRKQNCDQFAYQCELVFDYIQTRGLDETQLLDLIIELWHEAFQTSQRRTVYEYAPAQDDLLKSKTFEKIVDMLGRRW